MWFYFLYKYVVNPSVGPQIHDVTQFNLNVDFGYQFHTQFLLDAMRNQARLCRCV